MRRSPPSPRTARRTRSWSPRRASSSTCCGWPTRPRRCERAELGLARALALDAVTLLATFRRLRADALLASGRADEAHAELGRALAELDGQGAHERGFLLQGLARTGARVGDPAAAEFAEQAYIELARLGVRVEPRLGAVDAALASAVVGQRVAEEQQVLDVVAAGVAARTSGRGRSTCPRRRCRPACRSSRHR